MNRNLYDWENTHPANCSSIRECAYRLYDLLDDIDTATDAIPEPRVFYDYVAARVKQRFLCAQPDGDDLRWLHDGA